MDLGVEYIEIMENEKSFLHIDVNELCEEEVDRETVIGKQLKDFFCNKLRIP